MGTECARSHPQASLRQSDKHTPSPQTITRFKKQPKVPASPSTSPTLSINYIASAAPQQQHRSSNIASACISTYYYHDLHHQRHKHQMHRQN
jgi:hypothetical protein